MNNQKIARIFHEMFLLYEMHGDRFRARAYENGAEALGNIGEDVGGVYKREGQKGIEALQGIGRGMAEKIEEYIKTGEIDEYKALKKKMPVDVEGLTAVEGLGPKGVKDLYEKLKIKNLSDLEKATKAGKISKLKGFGEKSEKNILKGIEFIKKNSGRMVLGYVWPHTQELIKELKKVDGVQHVSCAGSLRRMRETIGDIDILVSAKDPQKVMEYFVNMKGVERVLGKGKTKTSVRMAGIPYSPRSWQSGITQGFDMDLRVVPRESWGAALQYFTGSKAHNIKLRQIAIEKGFKLNEYGLFRGKKKIAGETEEGVYSALGFVCPEPELREDTGEIEILCGTLDVPHRNLPKIIEYGSLKGDLQVQTNWTDGAHSIEEMAKEAKRLGREYIAITDHTASLAMTGGSDEKKLLRQMEEIDKLNKKIKDIVILKGAEVNILRDGSLDIKDEVLAKLDVVGISVHSLFNMSEADMTERITRAMANPHADILFHPTGRVIQKREAYALDIRQVIKQALKTGTLLEINAFPTRLDLCDSHVRMAVEAGARFVIDSDAHNKEHLDYLDFGVAQARRGWATKDDVINTLPAKEFLEKLK